jgi:hypothetical protein
LATAAEESDAKLDDVTFGEHVSGPEIKKSDLKGQVVALEIWGTT